jgi:putative spermidine/putrescine transport system permease protein
VVIPLSFNAEPYFTFTEKMLSFDPEGYSLRWYDSAADLGHGAAGCAARRLSWWADAWQNANLGECGEKLDHHRLWATILATVLGTLAALGLSRPEMPYRRAIMAMLISPDDRADHHHRDGDVLLLLEPLRDAELDRAEPGMRPAGGHLPGGDPGPCHAGHSLRHHHGDGDADRLRPVAEPRGGSLGANPRTTFFKVTMPLDPARRDLGGAVSPS